MRVLAPAKLNLHLRIGRLAADGFHPLLSWMCTAGLFDTLTFVRRGRAGRPAASDDAGLPEFSLSCGDPRLPNDRRNLVVAAATALADTSGRDGNNRIGEGSIVPLAQVSAYLIKRIPAGAGLAGGSSDAAATLLALNALWKLNVSASRLSEIAATLGSDVPFFLHGPSSICSGRGEVVRPIAPPAPKFAAVVLPAIEMPTVLVYRRFDELGLGSDEAIALEPDWKKWTTLSAKELLPLLVNDLEPPAYSLRPELNELRLRLEKEWVRAVRMSGSGSSLFTLCDTGEEAEELAARARAANIGLDGGASAMAVRLAPAAHITVAGAE